MKNLLCIQLTVTTSVDLKEKSQAQICASYLLLTDSDFNSRAGTLDEGLGTPRGPPKCFKGSP